MKELLFILPFHSKYSLPVELLPDVTRCSWAYYQIQVTRQIWYPPVKKIYSVFIASFVFCKVILTKL